ncbi:hypothetical protein V6N13_009328 [Hibiscus sabdariffa]|uniref:Uncharacterized protein n=1 Tax=Hibiscus sabdariffa TaxID=183260 RepID=A0ABR2PNJ6_9ROSI
MYGFFEKGVIPPPIRPDERSTELHPYSPGPYTSLSLGGWPPVIDLTIFKKITGRSGLVSSGLVPENARSFVVGAQNLPCSSLGTR